MAETDILNPKQGYDPKYKDSMNPNQGWQRTRKSTLATIKPAFGRPWSRESGNSGHSYQLSWTRRNLMVTNRLKLFFEQFETGFFTLIDWDTGRHYVGRFVGDMPQSFEVNGRFSSTGWTFEEVPGCPMLQYPDNWECWGVIMRPFDDFGDERVAVSSANWTQPAAVLNDEGVLVQPNQLQDLAPVAGDSVTFEYRGYGFQLWADSGPGYGIAQLVVDGVVIQNIDLYNADEQGVGVVYENTAMPLDIHRVELVLSATKNEASSGTGMLLDSFKVMR